jgi:hypothetical protein
MTLGKMIMLDIGGQPVTVMVEREQLGDLAAYGYPAERAVYVTAWNDLQIYDVGRRQPDQGDGAGCPGPGT